MSARAAGGARRARNRQAMRAGTVVACGLLASLLVAALVGCDTSEPDPEAYAETVIVEGTLPGRQDRPVALRFERLGASTGMIVARATSGAGFRVEVPAGDYRVSVSTTSSTYWLQHDGTMVTWRSDADTLRLRESSTPIRLKFPLGTLRLQGTVPPGQAATTVYMYAWRRKPGDQGYESVARASQVGVDGLVDLETEVLPAGDYLVNLEWRVDQDHQGEHYWLPGSSRLEEATLHHVGVDSIGLATMAFGMPEARLEGRVTGAWQAIGLDPPHVIAYDATGASVCGPWQLGPDGSFSIGLHRPVPVTLSISGYGNGAAWLGGLTRQTATIHEPAAGTVTFVGDHSLPGAVIRLDFDQPGAGGSAASVKIVDAADRTQVYSNYTVPGTDYELPFLAPGSYLVRVESDWPGRSAWRPQWYDRVDDAGQAVPVTINAGDGLRRVVVTLERGGVVAGRCDAGTANQEFQALLTFAGDDTVRASTWLSTADSLAFTWRGLADGAYKVGINPIAQYAWLGTRAPAGVRWHGAGTDWNTAAPVIIAGADSVMGLVIPAP